MAHFAELNQGVVTRVVVVHNNELLDNGVETEAKGVSFLQSLFGGGEWKQTSYNANGSAAKRYNYAGVGYTYDTGRDAFIPPKPYPSWLLDEATCRWASPVPYPDDGGMYTWDESAGNWVAVPEPQ